MTIREYIALPFYGIALFFIWITNFIAGDTKNDKDTMDR